MSTTTIGGHTLTVDQEGFLTDPAEWNEEVAVALAEQIGSHPRRASTGASSASSAPNTPRPARPRRCAG